MSINDNKPPYTSLEDRRYAASTLMNEVVAEAIWTTDRASKMLFGKVLTEEELAKTVGILADLDYIVKEHHRMRRI